MRRVTLSKLDLFIIAALVGGAFLIEHGNRTHIGVPTVADAPAFTVIACPANESVPFSPECMAFIEGASPDAPPRLMAPSHAALPPSSQLPANGP